MTFAAIQKLALRLPKSQRAKLANALLESVPPACDEVRVRLVKPLSSRQLATHLAWLRKSV